MDERERCKQKSQVKNKFNVFSRRFSDFQNRFADEPCFHSSIGICEDLKKLQTDITSTKIYAETHQVEIPPWVEDCIKNVDTTLKLWNSLLLGFLTPETIEVCSNDLEQNSAEDCICPDIGALVNTSISICPSSEMYLEQYSQEIKNSNVQVVELDAGQDCNHTIGQSWANSVEPNFCNDSTCGSFNNFEETLLEETSNHNAAYIPETSLIVESTTPILTTDPAIDLDNNLSPVNSTSSISGTRSQLQPEQNHVHSVITDVEFRVLDMSASIGTCTSESPEIYRDENSLGVESNEGNNLDYIHEIVSQSQDCNDATGGSIYFEEQLLEETSNASAAAADMYDAYEQPIDLDNSDNHSLLSDPVIELQENFDTPQIRHSKKTQITISGEYDIDISAEDWIKMKFCEESQHPETGEIVKGKFANENWGDLLSTYIFRTDEAKCSINVQKCNINQKKSQKKNSVRIYAELYCIFSNKSGNDSDCKVYYIATVSRDQLLQNGPVSWHIEKHGSCVHSNMRARRSCKSQIRTNLKGTLEFKNPTKHYLEMVRLHGQAACESGDATHILSASTYAQIKSEHRSDQHLGTDWCDGVKKRAHLLVEEYGKDYNYKGYEAQYKIQGAYFDIMENPVNLIISSQKQIQIIPPDSVLYVDLTGQLCTDIDRKKVLLTTVLLVPKVNHSNIKEVNKLIPVIQMFSNENNSSTMTKLILKLCGFYTTVHPSLIFSPKIINIDAAWELIYGILSVFSPGRMVDNQGNLLAYLILSHRIVLHEATDEEIKKFVNVHICYAHNKKNVCDHLSKDVSFLEADQRKDVKTLVKRGFYRLQNATVYDYFLLCFRHLCVLCLSEKLNPIAVNAIAFFSEYTTEEVEIEDGKVPCLLDVQDVEVTNSKFSLKAQSPFQRDCLTIYTQTSENVQATKEECENLEDNMYHLPSFIKYLLDEKTFYLSMWCGVLFEIQRYKAGSTSSTSDQVRHSNALIEAYHSSYKRTNKNGKTPDLEISSNTLRQDNESRLVDLELSSKFIHKTRNVMKREFTNEKLEISKNKRKCSSKRSEESFQESSYSPIPTRSEAKSEWSRGKAKTSKKIYDAESKSDTLTDKTNFVMPQRNSASTETNSEAVKLEFLESEFEGDFCRGTRRIGPYLFSEQDYESLRKNSTIHHFVLGEGSINPFNFIMCEWLNAKKSHSIISFPCELVTCLLAEKTNDIPISIVNWAEKYEFAGHRIWIFPINRGYHWTLLVLDSERFNIMGIDSKGNNASMHNTVTSSDCAKVLELYCLVKGSLALPKIWTQSFSKISFQNDGQSCGVYVCYWVYLICTGSNSATEVNDAFCKNNFRLTMRHVFKAYTEGRKLPELSFRDRDDLVHLIMKDKTLNMNAPAYAHSYKIVNYVINKRLDLLYTLRSCILGDESNELELNGNVEW